MGLWVLDLVEIFLFYVRFDGPIAKPSHTCMHAHMEVNLCKLPVYLPACHHEFTLIPIYYTSKQPWQQLGWFTGIMLPTITDPIEIEYY